MAAPAATYTKSGTKATTAAKLSSDVFGVEIKSHELLKEAYMAYLANGRSNLARTKTRGEVRGGGKKPWKQKGTGRARFGSSRVPIWRGGGITFGPTGEENYSRKLHVSAKRTALRQALTLAAKDGRIKVVEALVTKNGKTAELARLLLKIESKGKVLVVVADKEVSFVRAAKNLQKVTLVQANYLNVYGIMNADTLVIEQTALKLVLDWLGTNKTSRKETA